MTKTHVVKIKEGIIVDLTTSEAISLIHELMRQVYGTPSIPASPPLYPPYYSAPYDPYKYPYSTPWAPTFPNVTCSKDTLQ